MRYSGQLPTQLASNLEALHNVEMRIQAVVEAVNRDSQQKLLLERQLADLQGPAALSPSGKGDGSSGGFGAGSQLTTSEQLVSQQETLKDLVSKGATAEHPDVIAAKRAVRELQAKAEAEAATGKGALTQDQLRQKRIADLRTDLEQIDRQIAAAREAEQRLRSASAQYQKKIDAIPARETEMTELSRDYTTLTDLYTGLLQKNEDAKISENVERRQIGEQFNLLDPARLPEKPVRPNRPLINSLAMAGGLLLGLGLMAIIEYRDSSFKTDTEVSRVLSLPVLAVVPVMQSDEERRRDIQRQWLIRIGLSGAVMACVVVVIYTFVR